MRWRNWVAFAAILTGYFMALLDATIVNISLPNMATTFATGIENISWVVNGYNLAFAVLILTAARLADQFGRKRVFLLGMVGFTLTSALAALSPNVETLVTVRFLQGLAGAILVPVSIPLAFELLGRERQGLLMGIFGAISGIAAASGPALGGLLTSAFDWPAIFWVNVPLGVVGTLVTMLVVKESREEGASRTVDLVGMALTALGLGSVVWALINGTEQGWTSWPILTAFAVGAVATAAFVVSQRLSRDPMLPVSMFGDRTFTAANVAIAAMSAGVIGCVFLVSFQLREVLGLDSLSAGLTLAVMPLSSLVFAVIAGPLSARFDSRYFIVSGLVAMSAAGLGLSQLPPTLTASDVMLWLVLMGVGLGTAMTPLYGAAIRAVPPEKVGMASGLTNMSRAVGGVLGVAILVSLLNSGLQEQLPAAREKAIALVQADAELAPQLRTSLVARLQQQGFADPAPALPAGLGTSQTTALVKLAPQLKTAFANGAVRAFEVGFGGAVALLVLATFLGIFSDRRRSALPEAGEIRDKTVQWTEM